MGIDHYFMLGCLGHGIQVVVVTPLPVVMLTTRNHVADITALDRIVAIFIHKFIGLLHMALIVAHRP